MVELTFVLLLVMGGEKVEYTPYQSLSECLSVRRKIKRNIGPTNNFDQKWSCKELKVKVKDGEILEIVE
tara:strand:- start:58 stop:264 length:207 start_codon:yes stop_codon:yes gene_type:complete